MSEGTRNPQGNGQLVDNSVRVHAPRNCEFGGQLPRGVIAFTVAPNIRLFILDGRENQTLSKKSTLHEVFVSVVL
jgi:hypothetical protein